MYSGSNDNAQKLIVGLGNPGNAYYWTRHNIGFHIVETMAKNSEKALVYEAQRHVNMACIDIEGKKVILAVPTTYMNLSGHAVTHLVKKMNITPKNILVVGDDLETMFGVSKIVFNGGARGHNGVRSIHDCLRTKEINQLRFGIGRPPQGSDIAHYVLHRFTESEMNQLNQCIERSIQEIIVWATT